MKSLLVALIFGLSTLANPLFAQAERVQEVIAAQLEAFGMDDFEAAFEHAAPNIRQMFGTTQNFEQMVRSGYPMVYRHRSVTFGDYAEQQQFGSQIVRLEAMDGAVYELRYDMVATPEGWKIMGVQILSQSSIGA